MPRVVVVVVYDKVQRCYILILAARICFRGFEQNFWFATALASNTIVDEVTNSRILVSLARESARYLVPFDVNMGRDLLEGLSYRSIAVRVTRDSMIVGRIWNLWFQDGNTERRAGSQRPPITSS
ncbi:hypothetical protein TNCV_3546131 [Trichonephila clavipes]|nr:hypothetical protein TNCV_3546131 [Trichonephila clavipes]